MSGKPIDEAVERARQCIVMLRQHLALFVQDDVAQAMFRDADEAAAALTAVQQQAQESGGEVFGWVLGNAFVDARFWTGDTPPQGWTPVYCTAPPSAPVGVDEVMVERALAAYVASRGTFEGEPPTDRDDIRAALVAALAQHQEPKS